jgi:hypothetical protein
MRPERIVSTGIRPELQEADLALREVRRPKSSDRALARSVGETHARPDNSTFRGVEFASGIILPVSRGRQSASENTNQTRHAS